MKWLFSWCSGVLTALLFAAVSSAAALDVPVAPTLERPIIDQTGTLSTAQIDELSAHINELRKQKDFQLGVLMVSTLGTDALEDYSLRVARAWGIGEKPKNSGVLLLIVKDDRKLRIEVGSGQEGDLTDARSSRIIRSTMTPKLREGDYAGAIDAGVSEIAAAVQGRPEGVSEPASGWDIAAVIGGLLMMGISAISWLASIWARSKSWWAGGVVGGMAGGVLVFAAGAVLWSLITWGVLIVGGLLLDFLVSRNYKSHSASGDSPSWWAGGTWFGGSGSGGSSGGFGGGGFSGGGASGSW